MAAQRWEGWVRIRGRDFGRGEKEGSREPWSRGERIFVATMWILIVGSLAFIGYVLLLIF
jgi:hypothetical protein